MSLSIVYNLINSYKCFRGCSDIFLCFKCQKKKQSYLFVLQILIKAIVFSFPARKQEKPQNNILQKNKTLIKHQKILQILNNSDIPFLLQLICNQNMPFRNRYSKITLQKRKRLVDMVVTQKIPIVKAAKRLSIKSITARFIVAKYEKQGTFTVRKSDLVNEDPLPETPEVSSPENAQQALITPVRQPNQTIETLDAINRQRSSLAGWQWLWNGYGWVLCPFFA